MGTTFGFASVRPVGLKFHKISATEINLFKYKEKHNMVSEQMIKISYPHEN